MLDCMTERERVVGIGGGIGGLVAALELATNGCEVTVFDKASEPGGKMRTLAVEGQKIDVGPTVFTMRWVFDDIFQRAGASLDALVPMKPADVIARHAWN